MKKLIKFKTTKVVKEVELEIELPAYFVYGSRKPSDGAGVYFSIAKVTDPESAAEWISSPFNHEDPFFRYSKCAWDPSGIVNNDSFTQVDKSEWDLAVDMLIKEMRK